MPELYTFGGALVHLKEGGLVARNGWNGKAMFLFLVSGRAVTKAINDGYNHPDAEPKEVLDAIYMKTADGKLVPWLASQTDVLSEDWVLL